MTSLRWRMAGWFAFSLVAVTAVFVGITHWHLRKELQEEKWERAPPGQPEFVLHGKYSDPEIEDIVGELAQISLRYALPVALLALGVGYFLARRGFRPVSELGRQLQEIDTRHLGRRVELRGADAEFRAIEGNVNALLGRLDDGFRQLTEFSARVAHELRTPLTLLRLQVEEAAGRIEPGLAESLQDELRRLSDYVDQCLLLATAEQGRLQIQAQAVPLRALVTEMMEIYELLAREGDRRLAIIAPEEVEVTADPRLLRQILHNLLTNALRHGEGEIRVVVERAAGVTRCRVDNRPAAQGEASPGTGLGLRIVRALAGLHPGIEFRSGEDGGRFIAELIWR